MDRRLQFGIRENPASERRHGSRLAVSTNTSPNAVGEDNAHASKTAALAELPVASYHAPEHAVSMQSATVEKREETCGAASPIRERGQVPPGVVSHSHIGFEPLLDIIDAAKLLRIHPKTLRGKAARGIVPGIRIGRVWRFRASMLDEWLVEIANRGRGVKP